MDNGKCIMDNEGVAFGDIFEIIFEENTTIVNYQLSIIHSCVSTRNGNLLDKRTGCCYNNSDNLITHCVAEGASGSFC